MRNLTRAVNFAVNHPYAESLVKAESEHPVHTFGGDKYQKQSNGNYKQLGSSKAGLKPHHLGALHDIAAKKGPDETGRHNFDTHKVLLSHGFVEHHPEAHDGAGGVTVTAKGRDAMKKIDSHGDTTSERAEFEKNNAEHQAKMKADMAAEGERMKKRAAKNPVSNNPEHHKAINAMGKHLEKLDVGIHGVSKTEDGTPHHAHVEFRPDLHPHHEAAVREHAAKLGLNVKKTAAPFSRTKYSEHKPTIHLEMHAPKV